MFLGIKSYYASTREVATFNVPSAGSERGSARSFTPIAWNNASVPASCSTFRRIVRQQMEERFAVLPSKVPSAVVCVSVFLNPTMHRAAIFGAGLNSATMAYNHAYDAALERVLARRETSGSGSPVAERRTRRRVDGAGGDLADDESEFTLRFDEAPADEGDGGAAPPTSSAIRQELLTEKTKFLSVPPSFFAALVCSGAVQCLALLRALQGGGEPWSMRLVPLRMHAHVTLRLAPHAPPLNARARSRLAVPRSLRAGPRVPRCRVKRG